ADGSRNIRAWARACGQRCYRGIAPLPSEPPFATVRSPGETLRTSQYGGSCPASENPSARPDFPLQEPSDRCGVIDKDRCAPASTCAGSSPLAAANIQDAQ